MRSSLPMPEPRMRHNLRNLLHLEARTPTVRAIRAWRRLLPDWTPTLDGLRELDTRPHEHVAAVRIVAEGWGDEDARWDVLMALLEYERRRARLDARFEAWEESLLRREEDDGEDHLHVREDQMAGDMEREVPVLREVCPPEPAVLPDPEPVQSGPGDGPGEDEDPDPEGSTRSRPSVERVSPGVYRVRTLWGSGLWSQR